ncbi:MAG: Long-chain-fatty-acid--CoA ligase [Solirubrobacterales bacterium]|nr:Long-chain-fatty-acid--CoA ligase [Solirubrobacterales bacterium]
MRYSFSFRGHVLPLGAFVLACVAMALVLFHSGGGQLPGGHNYRVQAVVPTAVALSPGAEVRMGGVQVGRVQDIANRAGTAVLALDIDDEHAPVYRDARVDVRLKSLLGENYVEVDPGSPGTGTVADDGVLPLSGADEATQLDDVLSVFDKAARKEVRQVLDTLGGGLNGRGQGLNDLNDAAAASIDQAQPVTQVLVRQRAQVAGLVDDLGSVMRAVGDRGTALQVLARQGKVTAEAVASRDRMLQASLKQLPSALRQVRGTTLKLGAFSHQATPVVHDVASGVDRLGPAVTKLAPTARAARITVARLQTFATRGRPLLTDLKAFAGRTMPAFRPLDGALQQLNPLLGYLAPYANEVGSFFANLGSATNFRDATGNVARVMGVYNENSLLTKTPEEDKLLDALFSIGALKKLRPHGANAYPQPGGAADPQPFTGQVTQLRALPPVLP